MWGFNKMRRFSLVRRYLGCRDGATAVEFALISPVLFLLVIGIVKAGLIMSAQNTLESATYMASRTGRTGFVETGKTQEETIMDMLEERASLFLNTNYVSIDAMSVTTKTYADFDDINEPEPFVDANGNGVRDNGENFTDINGNGVWDEDRGGSGYGSSGEIVVYTVTYPWPLFTPLVSQFIGTDGIFTLTSRAVVKNEPY